MHSSRADVAKTGEQSVLDGKSLEHPQVVRERAASVDEALPVGREAEPDRRAQVAAGLKLPPDVADDRFRTGGDVDPKQVLRSWSERMLYTYFPSAENVYCAPRRGLSGFV